MILTQKWWECAWFAILWALSVMRPTTDVDKIAKEIIEEDGNSAGIMSAVKWFVKKWYIKGVRPCTYSPRLLRTTPIITSIRNVDWHITGTTYKLTYLKEKKYNSHYLFIKSPGVFQNSWGDWWDKWFFYFDQKQVKTFGQTFILVLD